jgi:predicted dehydrogenase
MIQQSASATMKQVARPRLAFLGVGWIGRHRLDAVAQSGCAEIIAVGDAVHEAAAQAAESLPQAYVVSSLQAALETEPDGLLIATPSSMHSQQTIAALKRGIAVFCQKPLARTETETRQVIEAARQADRLLAVDFCYRTVSGIPQLRELIRAGELGQIYGIDLVFHNAYGPDKPWFYDLTQSGGGCLIDLGIHLVDLALWALNYPVVQDVFSHLYARGQMLAKPIDQLEDYAVAQLRLETGATARLACSWRLPAGCDAVIEASFYGTKGGATMRNVNGSFYNFQVEHFRGTTRETLGTFPDDWGGRAVINWTRRLDSNRSFDPEATRFAEVAKIVDRIYGR